jgi:hypothetical protein
MQSEATFSLGCPQQAEHPRESKKPRHSGQPIGFLKQRMRIVRVLCVERNSVYFWMGLMRIARQEKADVLTGGHAHRCESENQKKQRDCFALRHGRAPRRAGFETELVKLRPYYSSKVRLGNGTRRYEIRSHGDFVEQTNIHALHIFHAMNLRRWLDDTNAESGKSRSSSRLG